MQTVQLKERNFCTKHSKMANYAQNGGKTFVAPTTIVTAGAYYTTPVATYPPTYALLQNPQPQQPAPGRCDSSFCKKSAIGLGVALVVCGAISQGAAAVALRTFAAGAEIGTGLWGGALVVAAGAVAIAAGHHGSKNLNTGIAATSAVAAAAAFLQIFFASWGLAVDLLDYTCNQWCNPDDDIYCRCLYDHWETLANGSNITMIATGSLAFIGSIWLLIVACIALCRKPTIFQVHALPIQNTLQVAVSHEVYPSQVQCIQHHQNEKSSTPLSHPPSNTISPAMTSQVHEHHEAPTKDDRDVEKL